MMDVDAFRATGEAMSAAASALASVTHSVTYTANIDSRFCDCYERIDIQPVPTPNIGQGERPKYDPHNARQLWQPEALQVTSKPRKRPLRQVEFNQVSKLRPVRPRYLSRKR